MTWPSISVALASHNGERYFHEQLASIARQTVTPDELIISDDCSTDGTIDIARRFASEAPFRVVVLQSDQPLGYGANFRKAVLACRMLWVLLCDQDDVWLPHKIETLAPHMAGDRYLSISHNFTLTDATLTPIRNPAGETAAERKQYLIDRGLPTAWTPGGLTMALKSDFARPALELLPPGEAHDVWINSLPVCANVRLSLDESLMLYRRHPRQVTFTLKNSGVLSPDYRDRAVTRLLRFARRTAARVRSIGRSRRQLATRVDRQLMVAESRAEFGRWLQHQYPDAYVEDPSLQRLPILTARSQILHLPFWRRATPLLALRMREPDFRTVDLLCDLLAAQSSRSPGPPRLHTPQA